MLWILLISGFTGIVTILVSLIFFSKDKRDTIRKYSFLITPFSIYILIGVIGLIGIKMYTYEEVIQTESYILVPIPNNETKFAFSYKKNSPLYFSTEVPGTIFFCYKNNDNEIELKTINKKDTVLCIHKTSLPNVTKITLFHKSKMSSFWRFILAFGFGESEETKYEISAPQKAGPFLLLN